MARKKLKTNFKQIISAVLVCVLFIGIIGGLSSILTNDMKKISPLSFDVGALDSVGKEKKSNTDLYTKEYFECQGLTIEVDLDSELKYKVFYYRDDKSFINSTGTLTDTYEKGDDFANAKYARVMVTPTLEEGDKKLTSLNKYKYAKNITIEVYKDQTYEAPLIAIDESVRDNYAKDIEGITYNAVLMHDAPFVPANMNEYSGKNIRRVCIPVVGVVDHTKDATFSLYVLKGSGGSPFTKVDKIELKIPANTFTSNVNTSYEASTNEVLEGKNAIWYEFDVNINLAPGQVLGFGDSNDTVIWAYRKTFTSETNYCGFYSAALTSGKLLNTLSVYFDVYYID